MGFTWGSAEGALPPISHTKMLQEAQDPTLRSLNTSPDQELFFFFYHVYLRSQNCRWVTIPSVDIVQPFCTENITKPAGLPRFFQPHPKVSIMVSPLATSDQKAKLSTISTSFPQGPLPQVF